MSDSQEPRAVMGDKARAWKEAEGVAYLAWNCIDGFTVCPFDGRTREGRAWSEGARAVFLAVRHAHSLATEEDAR